MQVIIVLLIIAIFVLSLLLWHYQRQVKNICRQLAFRDSHDSNMPISSETDFGGIGELKDGINRILKENKQQKIEYQNREKEIARIYTNLSHDIRTPLTSLDGYFQLLSDCENEEDKARYIGIIKDRIGSLNEMLEELFTYTKLKNDTYQIELSQCQVNGILMQTVLSYYQDWTARDITPTLSIADKPLYIEGNPQALRRVIQNILKNVLEHGHEEIRIALVEAGGKVVLTVSNKVPDPREIDVEKVFERFYKADAARGKASTGLGLSIAYELVKRMGGTIRVELCGDIFSVITEF